MKIQNQKKSMFSLAFFSFSALLLLGACGCGNNCSDQQAAGVLAGAGAGGLVGAGVGAAVANGTTTGAAAGGALGFVPGAIIGGVVGGALMSNCGNCKKSSCKDCCKSGSRRAADCKTQGKSKCASADCCVHGSCDKGYARSGSNQQGMQPAVA